MSEYLGFAPTKREDYFFVSYNSEDVSRVTPIVTRMAEDGVPLWYDYDLEYGEEWKRQITERIHGSRAVILFFTKGLLEKEESFVRMEYEIADFLEKKIYVVIMDAFTKKDVPLRFVPWYLEVMNHHSVSITKDKSPDEQVGHIEAAIGHDPGATVLKKEPGTPEAANGSDKPKVTVPQNKTKQSAAPAPVTKKTEPVCPAPSLQSLEPVSPEPSSQPDQAPPDPPDPDPYRACIQVLPPEKKDPPEEPSYSLGLKFKSLPGNTCVVEGIGTCTDSDVRIPPTSPAGWRVTAIAGSAFKNNERITSVTVPEGVTSIGFMAFCSCPNLTTVVLPDSVRTMGNWTIQKCGKLESIRIPAGLTEIPCGMCSSCRGLREVIIPEGVSAIGKWAFADCTNLVRVNIPASMKKIGEGAFRSCQELPTVYIPESVTSMGDSAFLSCHSLRLYCAQNSKPLNWHRHWNYSKRPVVWGYQPE